MFEVNLQATRHFRENYKIVLSNNKYNWKYMKALHVFPIFGAELTNGSEYYEYMLSCGLVQLGAQVDVFTTRSHKIRSNAGFSLEWPDDYQQSFEASDGVNIYRFRTSFWPSERVGKWLSHLVYKAWSREEAKFGTMLKGSEGIVEYNVRRAKQRSFLTDFLFLIGLGPWSIPLLEQVQRSIAAYDVVLVGFMPFALLYQVVSIAKAANKPVVVLPLFHPDDLYHHVRPLYHSLEQADVLLAQTHYTTSLFRKLFPTSNPITIGAGIDEKELAKQSISGARFREKYHLLDKKIVLYVGRKESSKRYDLAVDALNLIDHPKIVLVMAGSDVDLHPITSPNVYYLGKLPREDLLDAYDACDVFILPSEHESFGIVFLEAWMRRKPVVGNANCKPVAALIEHGVDGLLCRNSVEMAEAIALLITDTHLANRFGTAGYVKVHTHYTWNVICTKVYNIYHQLTGCSTINNSSVELP